MPLKLVASHAGDAGTLSLGGLLPPRAAVRLRLVPERGATWPDVYGLLERPCGACA